MDEKYIKEAANVLSNGLRTCEICCKKETLTDLMLKYDNGKIMCDDCAFDFYGAEEDFI